MTTKEQRELPDLIGTFFTSWETVRATDAAAAGVEAPAQYCPFDCAVRFGAVDSMGQAVGFDRKLAFTALAFYLEKVGDGREIFRKIMTTASRPDLLPWVNAGGQAVHAALTKRQNDFQAFGPIAARIRNETLGPPEQPPLSSIQPVYREPLGDTEEDSEDDYDLYPLWRRRLRQEIPATEAPITFSVLFNEEANAHEFALAALRAGYWVSVRPFDNGVDAFDWNARVQTRLVLTHDNVNNFEDMLSAIAADDDGFINGWRSLGVTQTRFVAEPRGRP